MVDYKYADLFLQDSIDKQITIEYDGGTITNTELFSESIELSESLCSESVLKFGCCEASVLKFKVANVMVSLSGKWLTVSEVLNHNTDVPFALGKYKVFSDKPTADRRYREVVAYDAMYDIINTDVSEWYNAILPNADSTMTMKEFRTSFISYFGLEQEEIELINDGMLVEKTIEPSEISGKDVITAICEINGCFGHIGRNGKFRYVLLLKNIHALYPANDLYPADDLFPVDSEAVRIAKSNYISAHYEDFLTQSITKLQIRKEENDIGVIVGTEGNCYIVQDNFLVYGKGTEDLTQIADNLLSAIRGITYRPYEAQVKGNPCLEVGDPVCFSTKYEIVESYILKRTLKGIQALKDTFEAEGEEYYTEKINSIHKAIIQLKGKANVLERTLEETRLTIEDVEKGLKSEITQTASEIRLEVSKTYETKTDAGTKKEELTSLISQTASSIQLEVSKTYETKTDAGTKKEELTSLISQTASSIQLEVSKTYETKTDAGTKKEELTSLINQTASSIRLEVTNQTDNLKSQINQNAQNISLKVSKNGVISEINQSAESITIKAARIDLDGLVSASQFTSKFATIDSLNGQKARIDNIEGNYISAGTVKANYMEVANWTSGGYIKAGKITADNITTGTLSVNRLDVDGLIDKMSALNFACLILTLSGISYSSGIWIPTTITISGTTYLVFKKSTSV